MASNKSFISLPSTPKLGASSSPLIGGGTKLSAAPKLKKSSFSFRPIGKSSLVDTISAAPPGQTNMEAISESLIETNRILVEIQNQLAMDFAYRIAKEKGELRQQRQEETRRKFSKREQSLEGVKGIFKAVSSVGKAIAAPFTGIFDKIMSVLGILTAGIASNVLFEWLKDENNQKKLKKFFNILATNWQLIAKVLGTMLALNVAGKLFSIFGILGKILALAPGLVVAAGIAFAIAKQGLGTQEKKIVETLEEMGGVTPENKQKLIKLYESEIEKKKSDPAAAAKAQFSGEFEQLRKNIEFLKTGKFGYAGKTFTFDWNLPFTYNMGGQADPETLQSKPVFETNENYNPNRFAGGSILKGRTYVTGEDGPELVTFPENGFVINQYNTKEVVKMIESGNVSRGTNIYDLRTIKAKKPKRSSVPQPPATNVPELSAVNSRSERMKYMSAYGLA